MSLKSEKELDLKNEKVSKIFWQFAIPSILAIIMQSTAGLIDSIFIGKYIGVEGLAAITLVMPIIMLLIGVSTMVAIGGTTLAGIYKGQGNIEKSNNFFNVVMYLLFVIAAMSTVLVLIFGKSFAFWIGATGNVVTYITDYSMTLGLFFIPFLLNFAMGFFLKLDGKPVVVVIAVSVGTIINIILDYVFIVYLSMGMVGAAFATGLSQLIPSVILLYLLIMKSNWKFKKPVFIKSEIFQIFFNGSSELLSMASGAISGFLFNIIIIDKIGLDGIAAYAVVVQVGSLAISIFYGFADSIQSLVSVNYGANQFVRVNEFRKLSLQSNLIVGVLICIVAFTFGDNIARIFIDESSTIELSTFILKFFGISYIFAGMNITFATYYTSVNSPVISGGLTIIRSLVSLIIGMLILPLLFGENGIWGAIIFAEVLSLAIAYLFFRKWPYGSEKKDKIIMNSKDLSVNLAS